MSRERPEELEVEGADATGLSAAAAELRAAGAGWINLRPVVEQRYEPAPPGPFAFLGGSTHQVPTVTWVPGRPQADGSARQTTVGIEHATGPRLAWRLRDLGVAVPDGWRVTQDHPRRGLVAAVPADADDAAVLRWLLQAATAACTVPSTGRWLASIHRGRI